MTGRPKHPGRAERTPVCSCVRRVCCGETLRCPRGDCPGLGMSRLGSPPVSTPRSRSHRGVALAGRRTPASSAPGTVRSQTWIPIDIVARIERSAGTHGHAEMRIMAARAHSILAQREESHDLASANVHGE